MNQQIKALIEKLTGYWKNLQKHQRRNLIIVAVLFVLTVAFLSWFALRPNYQTVLVNQTPASLGEVTTKLDELKIPYQTSGDNLQVPEQYVDEARMKLAMAGLPNTGTASGYSVFDNQNLGMTENEFNVRSKQAIETQIQNSILTLKGVKEARVNLVMPEKKLFVSQQEDNAKASVVLLLDTGVKLSADQVTGIQQLVSHSVPGLTPQNISLVDQNGVRLLDESGQPIPDGTANPQLTKQQLVQNQVESEAKNRIRDSLERLVGPGNVEVVVHADLNFDQRTWKTHEVSPMKDSNTGAVVSEHNSSEETTGNSGASGVAGTQSTDPGATPTAKSADSGASTSSKKDSTINRDWNTYDENGQSAPYQVKTYTVSVLINNEQLVKDREADIRKFVSTAIGANNDGTADAQITVTGGTFQAPANPFTATTSWYKQPWFLGALSAALVLLGGGVYAFSRRRKVAEVPVLERPRITDVGAVVEETENMKMKKQLEKLAGQKPEEFVNLLRTWLVEE
ncbi:flagellar M-ring protein FliF [Tumebacillus sp. ITR2]|uniref:Flagellar M-ring protein n=1 Tax=Tumebacillus amylolyticus TaxID=2801339 RepID=A0ABS1JF82_9BACL|nr:flagellar M-ring protein FliF [Tumebacillus amylolyticus]